MTPLVFRSTLAALAISVKVASVCTAAEPPAGTEIAHPADGAIMVYVPAGPFIMGLDESDARRVAADLGFEKFEALWAHEAYPKRTLNLSGYFIDKHEVTVERWKRFAAQAEPPARSRETEQWFDNPAAQALPAGEIAWDDAKRYAAWAGKALPTEAQWEKAARGPDGRLYPWGNEPPTPARGHFGTGNYRGPDGRPARLYTWVGRYPAGASPYGALDMLGNQYEWTADMNHPYPGNPEAEKMKDYAGRMAVLRGGSWYHGWVGFYAAKRFGFEPDETYYHVGFRTVWAPPVGYFESPDFEKAKAAVPEKAAQLAAQQRLAEGKPDISPARGSARPKP